MSAPHLSQTARWRHLGLALRSSVAASALFVGAASALAQQISVTDGSTVPLNGGAYKNVSNVSTGSALYAAGADSTIKGSGVTLSDGGFNSATVSALSGGSVNLTSNSTVNAFWGLEARNLNSQITMVGGTISGTTAARAENNASISLTNVAISSSNPGSTAINVDHGTLTMTGGSIVVTGTGSAVTVQTGTAKLDGVSFTTGSHALYALGISSGFPSNLIASNFTINTSGANAYGVDANAFSTTTLENGSISTTGANAWGVWAASNTTKPLTTQLTADDLRVNTTGAAAHGVVNYSSTVNLTDATIATQDAHGLYVQGAGRTTLKSGSITIAGTNRRAIVATGVNTRATVEDAAISASGTGTGGVLSNGRATVSLTNSTLSVSGASSYGVLAEMWSTVNLDDTDVTVSGQNTYALAMQGTTTPNLITVNTGTISSSNSAAIVSLGGVNTLSLTDATISGASLLEVSGAVISQATYAGDFTLNATGSTLVGSAHTGANAHSKLNLADSSWTLRAASTANAVSLVSALQLMDSQISFAPPQGDNFQTLNLGSYSASGDVRLHMNIYANSGGALADQKTDRLLINGDVVGATLVSVAATPGSPGGNTSPADDYRADEGISLIQVSGQSQQNAFTLAGGYTTLGGLPYQYTLHAYGPGSSNGAADPGQRLVGGSEDHWDYRLQSLYVEPPVDPERPVPTGPEPDPVDSNPLGPGPKPPTPPSRAVAPQVASYLLAPTALFQAGMMDAANLHRRLGEVRDELATGRARAHGEVFIRAYAGKYNYASDRNASTYGYDAKVDYAAVQMGANIFALEGLNSSTRFGVAGSVGKLHFLPKNVHGTTTTAANTWLVSAYGTHLHQSGWYIDGAIGFGGFNGDISTSLRGRTAGLRGHRILASVETGYPLALGDGVVLEPQAQITYQRLSFDRSHDVDSFAVSHGHQHLLTARVGAKLAKSFGKAESEQRYTIYGKLNVLHEIGNQGRVFLGESFRLGQFGSAVEAGVGINAAIASNLSFFGDAAYQHRIGKAGVSGFTFVGGLRHTF